MKILIITHTISPDSGGGRYSKAVLEEYDRRGISYRLITEREDLLPLASLSAFVKNVLTVRKAAKECDIVHVFDGWPYAVYARLAILFTNKRLFVNAVGTYAVAAFKSPLKGIFLRNAYRKAEKIYAISNFVKENVAKYIKLDTLEVVYLGTTPMPEPQKESLDQFKNKYGISAQTPILLTVGAIKDRKGHYETVEAVNLLRNKYPDILYCIVGTTKGSEAYVKKIEEYVVAHKLQSHVRIMTDLATDQDLACAYYLSDIFLLNSKYDKKSEHSEGFGLVLLEAAQFGKPVIGSRGSGIPEAMEDGYNGCLVDEVRAEEIASAVEKVLANYDEFALHSREVAGRFTWQKAADQYIKGYN
jgi:phosphatidylinositol alpha-1,6-mannosyltransferase